MSTFLTSISVFLTIFFLYIIFRFIQDQNLKHITRKYEISANLYIGKIINNPHQINITLEKEALKIMKKRYLKLKNKFKNDPKMLTEIARDRRDYIYIILKFMSEKEVFEIDYGDHFGASDAIERFKERVAALMVRKNKIEERFCKLLGISDISIKHIRLYDYGKRNHFDIDL